MISILKVKPMVLILILFTMMSILVFGSRVAKKSVTSYKKSVSTLEGDINVEIPEYEN
jgi:hypothetical protein